MVSVDLKVIYLCYVKNGYFYSGSISYHCGVDSNAMGGFVKSEVCKKSI